MQETVESIKERGVLTPAIVRPREGRGYEIVAGHRRKRACELAGLDTMPVIVEEKATSGRKDGNHRDGVRRGRAASQPDAPYDFFG